LVILMKTEEAQSDEEDDLKVQNESDEKTYSQSYELPVAESPVNESSVAPVVPVPEVKQEPIIEQKPEESVTAICNCGKSYQLKTAYIGKLVKCQDCGDQMRVGTEVELHERPQSYQSASSQVSGVDLDPVFDRDKFLLRQKLLSISEKYYVWDEDGRQIAFVERPRHMLKNGLAMFVGIIAAFISLISGCYFAMSFESRGVLAFLILLTLIGSFLIGFMVILAMIAKRHVTFFRDDNKQESLLEVFQDKKFQFPIASYTIKDKTGAVIAYLKKNYVHNILRKKWHCTYPDGSLCCIAVEDSIILSLLRRVLSDFYGLLRTNFIITTPDPDEIIGEFNRKFTLLDRYVLDLTGDSNRYLDRRIGLALGVMLDTGENR